MKLVRNSHYFSPGWGILRGSQGFKGEGGGGGSLSLVLKFSGGNVEN